MAPSLEKKEPRKKKEEPKQDFTIKEVTQMPKKEKTVVTKTTVLNKYFVEFKANIKGDRKEFGLLIAAEKESDLMNLIYKKLSKDYQGLRSINCMVSRLATDTDKEYTRDITENTRTTSDEKPAETNIVNSPEEEIKLKLIEGIIERAKKDGLKPFKILIDPNRSFKIPADLPRMQSVSYHKDRKEVMEFLKDTAGIAGKKFNSKWFKITELNFENLRRDPTFIKDIERLVSEGVTPEEFFEDDEKEEAENEELEGVNELAIEEIKTLGLDTKSHSNNIMEKIKSTSVKKEVAQAILAGKEVKVADEENFKDNLFDNYEVGINKATGFIDMIKPKAKNVIEASIANGYKKFLVTPADSIVKYKPTIVYSKDIDKAVYIFARVADSYVGKFGLYDDIKRVHVYDMQENHMYTAIVGRDK